MDIPPRDSPNLDLLRSLAVLFVVLSHLPLPHLGVGAAIYLPSYPVVALGYWGVFIFFVHTCYVLMSSLQRLLITYGSRRLAYRFWLLRVFRIYPLSMFVVASLAIFDYKSFDAFVFFSNLFLIQNLTGAPSNPGPLWSLPFELQMYLILPVLFVFIQKENKKTGFKAVTLLWGLSATVSWICLQNGWPDGIVRFMPCFLSGVLVFCMGERSSVLPSWMLWGYVLVTACLYPTLVAMNSQMYLLAWPLCLGLGALIFFVKEIKHLKVKIISKWGAKYSFSAYLWHVPCIDCVFVKLNYLPLLIQWLIFIFLLFAFCVISCRFIEEPFIKWSQHHMSVIV